MSAVRVRMVRVQVGRVVCRRDLMHRAWRDGEKEPAVGREPQANQRERDPGAERASHAEKLTTTATEHDRPGVSNYN